jgi:sugar-specific transcriptional regulator TrmB
MSLTSFVGMADVREKIKSFRPKPPRTIAAPLQVEPKSGHHPHIVGTAFDYLLRFEFQRRAPHAVTRPWVAEEVPDLIWGEISPGVHGGIDVLAHAFPNRFVPPEEKRKRQRQFIKDVRAEVDAYLNPSLPPAEVEKRRRKIMKDAEVALAAYEKLKRPDRTQATELAAHIIRSAKLDPRLEEFVKDAVKEIYACPDYPDGYLPPEEVQKRVRKILEKAKAGVAAYLKLRRPNRPQRADLAAHAVRLAKLDSVMRARRLDPRFEEADPEDVEDLLSLLAVVPFDSLLHDKVMLLNPHFRQMSEVVGGADADLITGDTLVDFKTRKRGEVQVCDLDQLFGYYLLARRLRQVDPTFPELNRLALYFCRHGYLWVVDATAWTVNPQFSEVEEWFFKRAKGVVLQA